jgi:phosphoglycolate phosphatase
MPAGAYRAVIFDMDGTLLNTIDDLADCMNRVLQRGGYPPHPVEAYRFFVGDGLENLVRRSLPGTELRPETIERLKEEMRAEYAEHWADKTRPYDGIPELLGALEERKIPMAVLSNKPHPFTAEMARHYFAAEMFEQVLGAREGAPAKPDPAPPLEIAAGFGLPPRSILYLGDTSTDMQTGRGAGMFTVGAMWGFRPREELLEHGAQALVESPLEILRFF